MSTLPDLPKALPSGLSKLRAGGVPIGTILSHDRLLVAPYFQRRYVWKKDEVEGLIDDVCALATAANSEFHFVGNVVLHLAEPPVGSELARHWIIDGQQRLTTVLVILLAAHSLDPKNKILGNYLEQCISSQGKLKVTPTREDTNQLWMILQAEGFKHVGLLWRDGAINGPLLDAFNRSKKKLRKLAENEAARSPGDLSDAQQSKVRTQFLESFVTALLNRLIAIEISVPDGLDSTQIFQSINGQGRKLEVSDLVRNLIAHKFGMHQGRKAEKFFEDDWLPFENSIGIDYLPDYLFVYSLVTAAESGMAQPSKSRVYAFVEQRWKPKPTADACLKDLASFQDAYRCLVLKKPNDKLSTKEFRPLLDQLEVLHRLEPPKVARSYLVPVIHSALSGKTDPATAARLLQLVETFLVRRAVISIAPTGLHALFKRLWVDAGSDPEKLADLLQTKASVDSPANSRIRSELIEQEKSFYRTKVNRFVLYEWELFQTRLRHGSLELLEDGQIDHVMPQNPEKGSTWWDLGTKSEIEDLVQVIGNLVLIEGSENASKGAEEWPQIRKRFRNESHSKAAQQLAKLPKWDLQSIRDRSVEMVDWICDERWPDLDTFK